MRKFPFFPKAEGDLVIGATINQHGLLRMRTTKVGADTVLASIIRFGRQLQTRSI